MLKKSFTLRISDEDRNFLKGSYETQKKKIEKGDDWDARWNWRQENSSLGAYIVSQALRQSKHDFPKPAAPALDLPGSSKPRTVSRSKKKQKRKR